MPGTSSQALLQQKSSADQQKDLLQASLSSMEHTPEELLDPPDEEQARAGQADTQALQTSEDNLQEETKAPLEKEEGTLEQTQGEEGKKEEDKEDSADEEDAPTDDFDQTVDKVQASSD